MSQRADAGLNDGRKKRSFKRDRPRMSAAKNTIVLLDNVRSCAAALSDAQPIKFLLRGGAAKTLCATLGIIRT